jgi:oligoendopeptidase F
MPSAKRLFSFFPALMFLALVAPGLSPGAQEKKIPDYSLTERKDVPAEFTWRIEDIYPSLEEWKADKEAALTLIGRVAETAQGWTSSPQKMLALFDLLNDINQKAVKLMSYASHQYNADMGNTAFQGMTGELQSIFVQLNSKLAFLSPDILALGADKFAAFLQAEPKLEPYRFRVEDILRQKAHILPAEQERIASLTGLFGGTPGRASNVLNDVEMPSPEVTLSDGQKVLLNFAAFQRLRTSKNAADRSLVMNTFWKNQKRYEKTLSILLDGAMKQHLFNAQVHGFKDCLEARLFGDAIDPQVYYQLIKSVRENLAPLHRYLALKKQLLGLETLRYDDMYASSVPAVDKVFVFEEARRLVQAAMKPLGPEYDQALAKAFTDRWIDIYPNKGKQSGAYSGGVYGVHPYLKLNYNGQYSWVATLAHELGHAMHSYFAGRTQPFSTHGYPTFLAEVASTFNEQMLMNELLRTEKDDLFKLYVLDSYLDQARSTLYRQTLLAEFELAMHRRVEEGGTLTADWLDQKYLELTRAYYGHDQGVCRVDDYYQVDWSRIPHFYLNYYVFQYSTGLVASLALSDAVLRGGPAEQARYLDFLKAGGSDAPIALLKKAGVDMTRPEPTLAALSRFNELVTEMEKLVAKLKAAGKL